MSDIKKTGLVFYLWTLVLNAGIVFISVFAGGASEFAASTAGWICAALVLYLLIVVGVIWRGYVSHSILKYGVPCVVALLLGYELIYGPTLHLLTLAFLVLGRIWDIRGK